MEEARGGGGKGGIKMGKSEDFFLGLVFSKIENVISSAPHEQNPYLF